MSEKRKLDRYWAFTIRATLDPERKAEAVAVARNLYTRKFNQAAPQHEERRSGEAIILAFPLPEPPAQAVTVAEDVLCQSTLPTF